MIEVTPPKPDQDKIRCKFSAWLSIRPRRYEITSFISYPISKPHVCVKESCRANLVLNKVAWWAVAFCSGVNWVLNLFQHGRVAIFGIVFDETEASSRISQQSRDEGYCRKEHQRQEIWLKRIASTPYLTHSGKM